LGIQDRPQFPLTAVVAWGLGVLLVALAGGAIASRFGVPEGYVVIAALAATNLLHFVVLLAREPPQQRLRLLSRWLMLWAWLGGFLALLWSAARVRHDRWAVLHASLHVSLAIGFVLLLGFATDGRGILAVVCGRRLKAAGRPSAGVEDRWFD
jgi:hypothetical protein